MLCGPDRSQGGWESTRLGKVHRGWRVSGNVEEAQSENCTVALPGRDGIHKKWRMDGGRGDFWGGLARRRTSPKRAGGWGSDPIVFEFFGATSNHSM